MINKLIKFNPINSLLIIALCLFSSKWIVSFLFFKEDLIVKILFESISDGSFFYPYIKFFSILDFTNSFNPSIENLKPLAIPFGSIMFHTIFYKLFGLLGLVLVEFFGIFLFLLIFYKIFIKMFTKEYSILLSLALYSFPMLYSDFIGLNLTYANVVAENLYSLRVHRPFPSSLYMYFFIYLLVNVIDKKNIDNKYFILSGITLGLSFSSFYYFSFIGLISFLFCLIYKLKKNFITFFLQKFYLVFLFITSFILICLPFFISLYLHENDQTESAGVFTLTNEKKKLFLEYYIYHLTSIKFLIINFIIFILTLYINIKKINHYKISNIFLLIYLASILAPILFIIIAPKSGILYHFNNSIILFLFFYLLINSLILLKDRFNLDTSSKSIFFIIPIIILTVSMDIQKNRLILKNFNTLKIEDRGLNKKKSYSERKEFQEILNQINYSIPKDSATISLLTFNTDFMKWAVMSGKVEYLSLTYNGLTSKKNYMIENDLINAFKFFELNENDFLEFLKNKKKNWRYLNKYVATFMHMKYSANSINTYKDSKNFEPNVKKFLKSSSPMYSQQLAIPLEEFSRLKLAFLSNKQGNFIEPKIIILDKSLPFIKKVKVDKDKYCQVYNGLFYALYFKLNNEFNCTKFL